MTLTLLYEPGSTPLGLIGSSQSQLGGAGSVLLAPAVGQFWLPILVHVSTRNGKPCRVDLCSGSIAALKAGTKNFATPAALSDPSTIKDFTSLGANDTSSILAGTIISYGEGIQVNFYNGLGADVGVVEVWGTSSDLPPLIGTEPLVPGVRFTGSTNAGETPVSSPSFQLATIAPGNFAPGTSNQSASNLDLRGYSSYMVVITATKQGFTSANIDPVEVRLDWFDQDGFFTYTEEFMWFADDRGGVLTPQNYGTFEIQDAVHGEFLNVTITNRGAIDNLSYSGEVRGSVRELGRQYLRNAISTTVGFLGATPGMSDTTILLASNQNIAAAGTFVALMPLRPGAAHLWLNCTALGIIVNIDDPTNTNLIYQTGGVAGNSDYRFIAPSSALRFNFNNTSGGAISIFATVTIEQPSKGT